MDPAKPSAFRQPQLRRRAPTNSLSGRIRRRRANLQTALSTAIGSLAQTALPAASAVAASNNFFADPPQIVTPPYSSATTLTNGTAANTVFWYTGENGTMPALQTATAQVGPSMTIAYGMRATEPAITSLIANVAALAATTFSASRSECPGELPGAVAERVRQSQRPVRHAVDQRASKAISPTPRPR